MFLDLKLPRFSQMHWLATGGPSRFIFIPSGIRSSPLAAVISSFSVAADMGIFTSFPSSLY